MITLRRFAFALLVLAATSPSRAQMPPVVAPNPAAPVLKVPFPLGIQRGTTLDLTLTGSNLAAPTGILTSLPGKVTIPPENNNGKDAAKLLVRLEVPKDAALGFYPLRLATEHGMSNLRLFCVDDLPQVLENATNHTKAMAQPVPVPCVVVGRADAEVNDYFKVNVKAGQRLSFEVLGRRLGSGFDPQLTLFDARTGKEVAGGYANDSPGLQTDARLTHVFKDAGDYLVEIRDVSYRGGEDYCYRLRIGDFPCATAPLPLAVRRGTKASIQFAGPTVDGVAPVEVTAPSDPATAAIQVAPRGANGVYGWPVSLALSDLEERLEQEPNNEPTKATRIAVPGAVTGRFLDKGDVDHYAFNAKKGVRLILEAHTQEHFSPAEVYAVLRDAKGNQLQATNPAAAPRLDFTVPADGDYYLSVEHLHYWGGPDEVYRVTVTPYEPGFDLSVGIDRYDVGQTATLGIPLLVARRDYPGPIEARVVGPAGLTGQATIPMGQPAQPNQPGGTLTVTAAESLPIKPLEFRIVGTATINGKPVTHYATVRAVVSKELGDLPLPPVGTLDALALAVTEKPPFTLAAKFDAASYPPGKPATITVTAVRAPGFTGEIVLAAAGQPANVTPALKNVPANANEAKVTLNVAANAKVGTYLISISGKVKHKNKDFQVSAAPASLVVKK
jgi:hypothetical protein